MAFQLSEDLAEVLGLKDDLFLSLVPLWVEHHSIPLEHALPDHLADVEYRRAHFNDLTDNFEEDVDIEYRPLVLTHFVVRYLPRLVETILLLPPVSLMYSPWFALLHFIGIRNPILASFMRTHKDRHALLAHLFKSLADATPSPKSFREWDRRALHWAFLANACRGHLYNLYADQPPRPPYPWLPSHREILKSYLDSFKILASLKIKKASPKFQDWKEATATLSFLTGALATGLAYVDYKTDFMPWSSCSGTEKDGRDCVKLKVGEEMYACGGCKTIRYCSREHQRADWKRHKPLCMVALWE